MVLLSVSKFSNNNGDGNDNDHDLATCDIFKRFEEFCRSFSWNSDDDKDVIVASLFYQTSSSPSLSFDFSKPLVNIYGPRSLPMTLLNYKFEVSIEAFFQANVHASEKLFTLAGSLILEQEKDVKDEIRQQDQKVLLDLCCGSGTIGIILSKFVHRVVGIELIPEAIEDAKRNAVLNGISFSYRCHRTFWKI